MSDRRRATMKMVRFALPVAPGSGPRELLEDLIEGLIAFLDRVDPDFDLEEPGDLEPSLGAYDAELDTADNEPSLGSLDRAIDQSRWSGPDCLNASADLEAEPYAREKRPGRRHHELVRRERAETKRVKDMLKRYAKPQPAADEYDSFPCRLLKAAEVCL